MKLRAYIFFILGFTFLSNAGWTQQDKDKVELLRVGFITKKLELSSQESEKFWPVYNEYTDKIRAIKRNLRQSYKNKAENLSDTDAEGLYQLEVQSKQAELDLFKQYGEKIKMIIGVKKFSRLRMAEEEFKREIINSIKEKSDGS